MTPDPPVTAASLHPDIEIANVFPLRKKEEQATWLADALADPAGRTTVG
jgi:hypothetical protein